MSDIYDNIKQFIFSDVKFKQILLSSGSTLRCAHKVWNFTLYLLWTHAPVTDLLVQPIELLGKNPQDQSHSCDFLVQDLENCKFNK